jgi:hypothetical protein
MVNILSHNAAWEYMNLHHQIAKISRDFLFFSQKRILLRMQRHEAEWIACTDKKNVLCVHVNNA